MNSYGIRDWRQPTGPIAWFANSALGAHEVDPQYSQACVAHDSYYPVGQLIDQSGWPLSFKYDVFTARHDCLGVFYPIPFGIDFAIFAVVYASLIVIIPKVITRLRHSESVTRRRIIWLFVASAVSILATYGTAHLVRITGPEASAPPILSAVVTSSYEIPLSFPLCPSANSTVEREICHGPELCTLTGISQPSDPRDAIQGWPLSYIYSSLDPCFGDTIYPLIFLIDALMFLGVLSAMAMGVNYFWQQRKKFRLSRHP